MAFNNSFQNIRHFAHLVAPSLFHESIAEKQLMGPGFRNQGKFLALRNLTNDGNPGALSIQPKIPEISVGSSNGTDHFCLVRPEYSGLALKVVHWALSIQKKNPEISVVAKVEFPIGKKLFHVVVNPGTWRGARPWTWNWYKLRET